MKICSSSLIPLLLLSSLSACGGDPDPGEGSGGATSGSGGATSSGGSFGATGGTPGAGGSSTGGAASGGGPVGELDAARVALARKLKRRISLGDSDDSACIVTAAGGVECRGLFGRDETLEKPVDLVAFSGLGYCVIFDDTSTMCDLADNVGADDVAFAESMGNVGHLVKDSTDALIVVDSVGGVRLWTGSEEVSVNSVPVGSVIGGPDSETCFVSPDGKVGCFEYFPSSAPVDKSGFAFDSLEYVDLDQSISIIAGISTDGLMRVRSRSEDNDITYDELQVQVATYSDYWCMVSNTGTVRCDSYNPAELVSKGLDSPPAGEFLVVDVNSDFACGVRPTGAVECWGNNAPTFDSLVRLD